MKEPNKGNLNSYNHSDHTREVNINIKFNKLSGQVWKGDEIHFFMNGLEEMI